MSICIRPQIILQLVAGYLLFSSLAISGALTNDIKAEIEAASRALVAAQLRYDAPAVARFLTRDFVYVGNDGSLADKTEFAPTAEDKKRRPIGLLKWELLQVRFYGDTAVALYSIHEKSSMNGKLTEFQGRSLAIWVKQNGHWLCAAIHD